MHGDIKHEVERLALWGVLRKKGTDEQRALVRDLVDYAAPILDRVIETFATYTLHNSIHARNVAQLMASLLGSRIAELSSLEAAFLILAAYYHDIGMVFDNKRRRNLSEEPHWNEFLAGNPKAYLAVGSAAEIPQWVAECYCRWRHADRVFLYLNSLAKEKIRWGSVDIRPELGELCRSHNMSAIELQFAELLQTRYLAAADLRFCAILLRLADILDFDRSRAPDSVYQYLGLAERETPRDSVSDIEWRKHANSDGVIFPDDRSTAYDLDFVAAPDHPAVEHDLRAFLDTIDNEFEQCRALLELCSDRWRDLALPLRVRRDNIRSEGYIYGEYRFTLDQDKIIQLLMGENLYASPFVFVREIVQNAIDASRLRQHFERARGNAAFEVAPIVVTQWVDKDRYLWVRFDDFGTGMDEQIIRDHLLKVGSSYYRSQQYEADILRASKMRQPSFAPISRFGIGLLSSFIACDRIEISTLRQLPNGQEGRPIRLRLDGTAGFFTLQLAPLAPQPMPVGSTRTGEEAGYRLAPGTAIACRLDPTRERATFDLQSILNECVHCSPVPVKIQDRIVGGNYQELTQGPLCSPTTIRLPSRTIKEINRVCRTKLKPEEFGIEVYSLDLTRSSVDERLKGQIVVAEVSYPDEYFEFLRRREVQFSLKYGGPKTLILIVRARMRPNLLDRLRMFWFGDRWYSDWNPEVAHGRRGYDVVYARKICIEDFRELIGPTAESLFRRHGSFSDCRITLSHNGVLLHSAEEARIGIYRSHIAAGIIALRDHLRPNLSVARDQIRSLPWELMSIADLTLRRSLTRQHGRWSGPRLGRYKCDDYLSLGRLMTDPLLAQDGAWSFESIFHCTRGDERFSSLQEIFQGLKSPGDIEMSVMPMHSDVLAGEPVDNVAGLCARALASAFLDLELRPVERNPFERAFAVFAVGLRKQPLAEGEKLFPPLSFIRFAHSKALRGRLEIVNRDHPFAVWLLERSLELRKRYPGILDAVISNVLAKPEYWRRLDLTQLTSALKRLAQLEPGLAAPVLEASEFDFAEP